MGAGSRWLVVEAGAHRVALPAHQVRRVERAGQNTWDQIETGLVESLAECLGGAADPPGGFVVWLQADGGERGVRVRTVLDFAEGPEPFPLPGLLRRACGPNTPVTGVLLWEDRLIPVVDLGRLRRQGTGALSEEAAIP